MDDDLKRLFAAYRPSLAAPGFVEALQARLDAQNRRARRLRRLYGAAATLLLLGLAVTSIAPLREAFAQLNVASNRLNDALLTQVGQWTLDAVAATALLVGRRRIRILLGL